MGMEQVQKLAGLHPLQHTSNREGLFVKTIFSNIVEDHLIGEYLVPVVEDIIQEFLNYEIHPVVPSPVSELGPDDTTWWTTCA